MVDTGAAFTMVTSGFCKKHNLTVNKLVGTYRQADGVTPGHITGYVEMAMQISDGICFELTNVKVIPSDDYHALLGCDLLMGDGTLLKVAQVKCDDRITWVHQNGLVEYVTRLAP
jgi:hypothetical protein